MLPKKVLLRQVKPSASTPMVCGIDVAHHQGTIDWDAVEDPQRFFSPEAPEERFQFAFVRVSDGDFLDRQFERNWKQVREVGLIRGVYQYFRVGRGRAVLQADIMLERIAKAGGIDERDFPPVIDIENLNGVTNAQEVVDDVLAWAEHVEKQTGVVPILYTYPAFWSGNRLCCCNHMPLWIAHYRGDNLPGAHQAMTRPPLIPTEQWAEWMIWQHSSTGRITGIKPGTNVDLNVFNGDMKALQEFIRRAWNGGATTPSEAQDPALDDIRYPWSQPPCEPAAPGVEIVGPSKLVLLPSVDQPDPNPDPAAVVISVNEDDDKELAKWSDGGEAPTLPSRRPDDLVPVERPGCMGWLFKLLGWKK